MSASNGSPTVKQRAWSAEEDSKLLSIILSKANLKIDWPTVAREMSEDRTRIACERRWQRIMAKLMNKGTGSDESGIRVKRRTTKVKREKSEDELEE